MALKAIAEVFALAIVNATNVTALTESNRRFETIIDSAPIGMSLVTLDGRFIKPNKTLCDMLDYTAEELTQMRFQDITHPDDLPKDEELLRQLRNGEIPRYSLEKRYIKKNGEIVETILSRSLVRGPEGPLQYISQIEDVTEENRRRRALQESEDRFRLIAENARDLVYRYRIAPTPAFEYVSPSALRITGYTPEEHYANPALGFELIHPDDRHLMAALQRSPDSMTEPVILRFRKKDATVIWVEQQNTPILDATGNLVGITGIARDITDRKLAEEALRQNEQRLQFIVTHLSDPVFFQDKDLRYVWTPNPQPPFAPDDLTGKTEFDVLPTIEAAHLARLKRQVIETGKGLKTTVRLTLQGKPYVMEMSYEPWRDEKGNIIGIAGHSHDITESKKIEETLKADEESLRLAQQVARIGSWDWNLETGAIRWSDEVFRMFGLDKEKFAVSYDKFIQFIHPDDRALVETRVRDALSGGPRYKANHRIIRPDGSVRVIHEQGDLLGPPDCPQRMVGTSQDITEQYELEQERERLLKQLASEKKWLDQIVENSPTGIILIQGKKMRMNHMAESMFGQPFAPNAGPEQYASKLFHLDGKPVPKEEMISSRVMRGEKVQAAEFVIRRSDGSSINIIGSAAPIFDGEGRLLGGIGVFEDISRIKELERMREEWNSVVAHDLRQPLTTMLTQTELLKAKWSKIGAEQGVEAKFDSIIASVYRVTRMANELLDASVIEAHRLELRQKRLEMVELTKRIVKKYSDIPNPITVTASDTAIYGYVDAERLEQMLLNLITNAAKYGKSETPIVVAVERQGAEVVLSVTNEGEGIPEHEMPLLFNRFRRSLSSKKKSTGLGLGLYIVKGLAEAHGGRIWGVSTPGKTTTFSFTLPIAREH
jgi:PAS domain S-box-containing protein